MYFSIHVSHEKKPGCLGYYMGIILPTYVGIIINHDKDPCINNQYDVFFVFRGSCKLIDLPCFGRHAA